MIHPGLVSPSQCVFICCSFSSNFLLPPVVSLISVLFLPRSPLQAPTPLSRAAVTSTVVHQTVFKHHPVASSRGFGAVPPGDRSAELLIKAAVT